MNADLRPRVIHAVGIVYYPMVKGEITAWRPVDQHGQALYREALTELANLIACSKARVFGLDRIEETYSARLPIVPFR
jgi:hypothetical protein